MSKETKKDYEILSAYLDGEVSLEQIQEIEKKLASSENLRNKLEELKKIKHLTSSSFEVLEESPYFETILNQRIKGLKKWRHNLRVFAPVYGLGILAIIVILLLKFNPKILNNPLNNQNTNLAGLYSNNLKPLLFATDLSNEDIFNFAFYKQLPLDNNNNQYLQLGMDDAGKEYFEIKKNNFERRKNNLEKFSLALGLNEAQKNEVDSIIKTYSDQLQEQILVNDKNTLAVSQNLFDYNRALASDLLTFAAKANKNKFGKIMPAGLSFVNNKKAPIVIKEIRTKNRGSTQQFVFFNEDTIFTEPYTVNKQKLKAEIAYYKARAKKDSNIFKSYSVNIKLDSNLSRIKTYKYLKDSKVILLDSNTFNVKMHVLPHLSFRLPNIEIDSLVKELDKARENFKEFSYSYQKYFPKFKGNFKFNYSDSAKDFDIKFKRFNTDSLLKLNLKLLDSLKSKSLYRYKFNNDSLKVLLDKMPKMYKNFKWYDRDKEIKELKEEMKELKKELKEMKKKLSKSNKRIKT